MASPAENQQTVEAALDRFVYDTSSREWLTEARAALRDLVAQAQLAADMRDAWEEIESWPISGYHQKQAQAMAREMLARLDGVAAGKDSGE